MRVSLLASCAFVAMCATMSAASLEESKYNSWPTQKMRNDLVELHITPQLGGRIMQVKMGKHEFFYVDRSLAGKGPTKSGLGPKDSWLNYGGSKLWPSPQGWSGEEEWPGPPGAVLDGSAHAVTAKNADGATASLSLESANDPQTGIKFSKTVSLTDGSTRVSLKHTMTNVDSKPRRWGIWQVTQFDARSTSATGFNNQLRAYCLANPQSKFPRGYQELFGIVNNPCFSREKNSNLISVSYDRLVGKVGTDCSAGWQAVVDENSGYAFVERFTYFPGEDYPAGGDSTEVWINGPGHFFADKLYYMPESLKDTPAYMESEIMAPLKRLGPGQSAAFDIEWGIACTGKGNRVIDCADGGVVCEPLKIVRDGDRVNLTGKFGVFYAGELQVMQATEGADEVEVARTDVSPLEPVDIAAGEIASVMKLKPDVKRVTLRVLEGEGNPHPLASAELE